MHVLETLRFDITAGPALIRVYARQGMLAEIRRWDHGTKKHPVDQRQFREYDEAAPDLALRRCTQPPPIELMIDLLRELLKLRLSDAFAWTSARLCDNDHDTAARELGEVAGSQRNRVARAAKALQKSLREYEPKPGKPPCQRAVELFREGASCAAVARATGLSETEAAAIQDSLDPLAKRRRAAQAKAMRIERTDVRTADIIMLRRAKLTEAAIAAQLGCSQKLVNKRLHKLGIHEGRIDSRRRA